MKTPVWAVETVMTWKVKVLTWQKKFSYGWVELIFSILSLILSCCLLIVTYTPHLHSYRLSCCFPLLWLYRPHAFHLYCDFPPFSWVCMLLLLCLFIISKHSAVLLFLVWYLFSVFVLFCLPFLVCLTVGSLFFGCLPECQPTFVSKKKKNRQGKKKHFTIFKHLPEFWASLSTVSPVCCSWHLFQQICIL